MLSSPSFPVFIKLPCSLSYFNGRNRALSDSPLGSETIFSKNSHAIWWKDVRGFGFGFPSGFLVPKQKCKDQVRKAKKGKR